MKVMEKDGSIINVFGIYWHNHNNETYFSGFDKNHEALNAFRCSEVEVIDPKMDFKTVFFTNHMSGIFHWALIELELLDGVIEYDAVAVEKFKQILKSEQLLID